MDVKRGLARNDSDGAVPLNVSMLVAWVGCSESIDSLPRVADEGH